MTTPTNSTKLTRSLAAAALALPLSVVAVVPPAAAAASTVLTDVHGPGGFPPGVGFGFGVSGGQLGGQTATLDVADATAAQSTGLVEIATTIGYDQGQAAGSGIILSSDGLVVTNHHVVEGATDITVTVVSTGEELDADVVGYDATRDVAVLRLEDAADLTTATTSTNPLAVGDAVTAVGDAYGDGGSLTAAPGTVTDLHEPITVADELTGEAVDVHNLIQVTSDVVAGDSGGALLDEDGDVVGMNVAASSGAEIDGYVIPIARVLRVVDAVLAGDESGSVVVGASAFLGVELAGDSTTLAGVVDGGPAQDLGLAAGDTVTRVDGSTVSTATELRAAITDHEPGEVVSVAWTDGAGTTHRGTVALGTGPVG